MTIGLNPAFTDQARKKQPKPRRNRVTEFHKREREHLRKQANAERSARLNRPIYVAAKENPRQIIDGKSRQEITRGMARIIKNRSRLGLSSAERHLVFHFYTENQIQACAAHAVVMVLKGEI